MAGVKKAPKKKANATKRAAAKAEPCVYHPPGRIIGGHCMACDHPVTKK